MLKIKYNFTDATLVFMSWINNNFNMMIFKIRFIFATPPVPLCHPVILCYNLKSILIKSYIVPERVRTKNGIVKKNIYIYYVRVFEIIEHFIHKDKCKAS